VDRWKGETNPRPAFPPRKWEAQLLYFVWTVELLELPPPYLTFFVVSCTFLIAFGNSLDYPQHCQNSDSPCHPHFRISIYNATLPFAWQTISGFKLAAVKGRSEWISTKTMAGLYRQFVIKYIQSKDLNVKVSI